MEVLIAALTFSSSMSYVEDEHVDRPRNPRLETKLISVLVQSSLKHCRLLALAFMGKHKALLLRNCVEAKPGKIPCCKQKEFFEVNTWSEFVPRPHFFFFRSRKIRLFPRKWLRSYHEENEKSI